MMRRLSSLYRRIESLTERLGVRLTLAILAVILVAAVMIPMYAEASSFGSTRLALIRAIEGKNVTRKDSEALQLRDSGTIDLNGVTYGGEEIVRLGELLFDATGDVAAPGRLVELMLSPQRPRWIPEFLLDQSGTMLLVAAIALAWLQLIIWLGLSVPFLFTLLGTMVAVLPFWLAGSTAGVLSIGGMGLLTFSFVLLIRCTLVLLQGRNQTFAVAHTVVKEATRLNISLAFIVVLLVMLPLLPLWIDGAQPLRYQVQTFIARSLTLTYVAAACMTLLLSCATVAFEIRDRQIWQLMTKPIGRFRYLLGKFIGVAALNLVLLLICGLSIFIFVQYLRTRPASDIRDAAAVRDEVLTARSSAFPIYQSISRDELLSRIDRTIEEDAIMSAEIKTGQRSEQEVRRSLALQMTSNYLASQREIQPGEKKTFVFPGLGRARASGAPLTLRYTFYAGKHDPHEVHPVIFEFDGLERVILRQYVPVQGHVLTVPSSVVRDDGTVEVTIYNAGFDEATEQFFPGRWAINFDAKDFELLFKVSDFEWNFLRAIAMLWIKLSFLAMLGVCAATILSFPVACILSFTVFLIGSMAPFIAESLEYWAVDSWARVDQLVIMWIASAAEWMLRSFGSIQPTNMLVEGRLISFQSVLVAGASVGLLWCGGALLIGWLGFRRKELAIYSGHG